METIHLSLDPRELAFWFCVFWIVTFSAGLRYGFVYAMRVSAVTSYSLMTWADNRMNCSVIEYAAQCLVMCSSIGFVTQFFTLESWRSKRV